MVAPTPTRLGRYQILDEIGKGAMGVVYLAKDPLIGRLVALKTFRMGDLDDEDQRLSRERFMREAQSAGILSHPNIVTVHDVVEEEELTFIAMEFVRGTDLKELLRRGESFELTSVSEIIWQVAEALEYAHSKGVVHRDIKPANILITADGRVKLTDFGIARLDTSNLTHDGQLLGTPNYMSPEQIRGGEVDHRADIFSLGVVLYEMLTRRKPFQGENLTVVTHRIVHEDFTPPEDYVGPLPEALMRVLDRALAKDPDERYQHVGELARDLKLVAEKMATEAALSETREIEPVTQPGEGGAKAPLGGRLRGQAADLLARVRGSRSWSGLASGGQASSSPRRLALLAALTMAATLLLGWGTLILVTPRVEPAAEAARDSELERIFSYVPWLFDGRRLLEQGEPGAAAVAFAEAERLAPGEPRLRALKEEAERQAAEMAARALKEEAAQEAVAEGEEAFGRRRFTTALEAAERALTLVPDHEGAQDLLARTEVALNRRQPARAPGPRAAPPAGRPASAEPSQRPAGNPAVEPDGGPSSPAGAEATLHIRFHSERSQGVLVVYAGQDQLLRETFKFTEKSGFFRSRPVAGDLARTVTVPAGSTTLRVYVTLDKTRLETLQGNFPAGSVRTLDVQLSEGGDFELSLR